jgi:hypothetical protein
MFSQKERANIWYMNLGWGLDFNTLPPTVITNGAFIDGTSFASICDNFGNLLFYTDGVNIYNKDHQVMENGENIDDIYNRYRSVLITPKPLSNNVYYLFQNGSEFISIIDLTYNTGLGKVIQRPTYFPWYALLSNSSIIQKTGTDYYWQIVPSGSFYPSTIAGCNGLIAELITENGISLYIQTCFYDQHLIGCQKIKMSPVGNKLAAMRQWEGVKEIFLVDFNNSTGVFSNKIVVNGYFGSDLSFSPDGSKLYFSENDTKHLYQLNITNLNIIDLGYYKINSLQLAPNGKIYFAKDSTVGVIHCPNNLGINCNIESNYINIPPDYGLTEFPSFVESWFANVISLTIIADKEICLHSSINFSYCSNNLVQSVVWDFGDSQTSIGFSPTHTYESSGTYTVTLTGTYINGQQQTITQQISVTDKPTTFTIIHQ